MNSIRIINGEIRVPVEVFVAWAQPRSLTIRPGSNSVLVHVPTRREPLELAKWLVSSARSARSRLLRIDSVDGSAVFGRPRGTLLDGEYMAANYHPLYELMYVGSEGRMAATLDRASANAGFWSKVAKYHEHLPVEKQDDEAHEASKLLVASFKSRVGDPGSILELGCGAGRNLWHIGRAFPGAEVHGIDINPAGVSSKEMPANVQIRQDDVLSLDWKSLGDYDIIFTAGFLMHINHENVRELMTSIHRHSKWHFHFELHGPAHEWDYHRYPRSYRMLMDDLRLPFVEYEIFAFDPVYSHGLTPSFAHAILVSTSNTSS